MRFMPEALEVCKILMNCAESLNGGNYVLGTKVYYRSEMELEKNKLEDLLGVLKAQDTFKSNNFARLMSMLRYLESKGLVGRVYTASDYVEVHINYYAMLEAVRRYEERQIRLSK